MRLPHLGMHGAGVGAAPGGPDIPAMSPMDVLGSQAGCFSHVSSSPDGPVRNPGRDPRLPARVHHNAARKSRTWALRSPPGGLVRTISAPGPRGRRPGRVPERPEGHRASCHPPFSFPPTPATPLSPPSLRARFMPGLRDARSGRTSLPDRKLAGTAESGPVAARAETDDLHTSPCGAVTAAVHGPSRIHRAGGAPRRRAPARAVHCRSPLPGLRLPAWHSTDVTDPAAGIPDVAGVGRPSGEGPSNTPDNEDRGR